MSIHQNIVLKSLKYTLLTFSVGVWCLQYILHCPDADCFLQSDNADADCFIAGDCR